MSIPKEILDKYLGPQDLLSKAMQKTDHACLVELNKILKTAYLALFQDNHNQ